MKLHVIDTGLFKLDGGAMYGVVPKTLWSRHQESDEMNRVTWAMRCLLIEKDDKLILIDTGVGDKQSEKFFNNFQLHGTERMIPSIAKAGFKPEDITDVVLTHLHFDHCGGAVSQDKDGKLSLTFPNATYWSEKEQWHTAMNPNSREKASFLKENIELIQQEGKLKFIDEYTNIIPELTLGLAHGHTEGMIIPFIDYKGRTIVYMADLIASPSHIPLAWVMGYDLHPLTVIREKDVFLKDAIDQNYILFFEHDANIEACTVKDTPKGVRADKMGDLKDFID
ncbi:MAG: glyoxylase-like metal-dependent hydrolase (beta-lactamase superfamily II) [Planctomycetota bacterium]|jgi:glyoxylase-like metal-dependent hydrolase (beta-lactamase superfamily II)